MTLTATDFYSGAGGSSEGLRLAGWDIRACANHWERAVETHRRNHPDAEHHLANLHETEPSWSGWRPRLCHLRG